MTKVIAVCNQKGGVGKTTTAVNLSAYLSQMGRRVLFIDLDPQANGTTGLGINPNSLNKTVYHLLAYNILPDDLILKTRLPNLDILPASQDLIGIQIELINVLNREFKLKEALTAKKYDYDYVIIDLPPSLGLLTINGLVAAEYVIIPIQTEYYALEGLSQLVQTVDLIRNNLGTDLKIMGALLTLYDRRNRLDRLIAKEIRRKFSGYVFNTVIPRNVSLAEAPSFSQTILEYSPNSEGGLAFRQLTQEVLSLENVVLQVDKPLTETF